MFDDLPRMWGDSQLPVVQSLDDLVESTQSLRQFYLLQKHTSKGKTDLGGLSIQVFA